MAETIVALMSLLILGFSGTKLAKIFGLPHSVFLVFVGIIGGTALRHFHPDTASEMVHFFPEIILLILLPPLIFESAYNLDLRDLRRDLVPISGMATIGLGISTLLVGLGFHHILGLQLLPSMGIWSLDLCDRSCCCGFAVQRDWST